MKINEATFDASTRLIVALNKLRSADASVTIEDVVGLMEEFRLFLEAEDVPGRHNLRDDLSGPVLAEHNLVDDTEMTP